MFKKKNVKDGTVKKENHKRITFKINAPDAQCVLLAGDFNSWDPEMHPLKKSSKGLWKKMVSLSPGDTSTDLWSMDSGKMIPIVQPAHLTHLGVIIT